MAQVYSKYIRTVFVAAIGFGTLGLVGCASQDQFTAMKMDRDSYVEQLRSAQLEARQSSALAADRQRQIDAFASTGNASGGMVANLTSQVQTLQAQVDDYKRRYEDALANGAKGGIALNPVLSNALSTMASENPDLVEFDSAQGVVKFKSDVTFGVGDATVTGKAKDVIDRFAKILTSGSAAGYELQIAGHTDNTPVSSQATKAAGHKDNWYLSAHRAIAVASELMKNGVSSARVGVVGYADQRPAASNATSSGQATNRRVEVRILPNTVHTQAPERVATTPRREAVKASKILNKDSGVGSIPTAPPSINK